MSKLDELIQELCPNGVEFKPLAQCCSSLDNKRKPVTKSAREEGEYQLAISLSDYTLSRNMVTASTFVFDKEKEERYFDLISKHTIPLGEKMTVNSNALTEAIKEERFDSDALLNVLTCALDYLSDVYFMKTSFNRYCRYTNLSVSDMTNEKQLCKNILQIDDFVCQTEINAKTIEESLLGIRIVNKISSSDYKNAMKLIEDIKELFEKHQELQWFGKETIESMKEEFLDEIVNEKQNDRQKNKKCGDIP